MAEIEAVDGELFPQSVGEKLKIAREAAGLDLNDIGTRTRIPMRHLEAIERGDYAALPSPTYAMGFTRAFARAVGLEEAPLVRQLREELGREDPEARDARPYEPVDPSRVPSKLLVWTALALIVLFVGGYTLWRTQYFGSNDAPVQVEEPVTSVEAPSDMVQNGTGAAATPQPATAPSSGEVVLTAIQPVWLRISDTGKRLFEKEMAAGETYIVPATATNPVILTGRADALKVTVGGREVTPLGPPQKTISNVGVSAAALAARPPSPPVTAVPAGTTPPVAASAPTPITPAAAPQR